MSFFDQGPPPPVEPEPSSYRQPAWSGPPENAVGRAADVGPLLVRTPEVAVAADGFVAYPTGAEFRLVLLARPGVTDSSDDPVHPWRRRPGRGDSAGSLRFGLAFADGTKVLHPQAWWPGAGVGPPPHPVLASRGGGGGDPRYGWEFWLWPLPPPGPFAFVAATAV